jgi:hypothetical protein
MKRMIILLSVLLTSLVSTAWAQQPRAVIKPDPPVVNPLVLYDDFNGRWIDPAKWVDWSDLRSVRHAVIDLSPSYQGEGNNRRLRIFQRANSITSGDSDVRWGWLGLQVPNPGLITEFSFDITVTTAASTPCQSNPNIGGAWAGFVGRFFNYNGQQNGDQGDVEAGITLRRDGPDSTAPLRVDIDYQAEDGSAGEGQALGFVSLGQTAKFRVKWDHENHQFIFQMNKNPEVFMVYDIPDATPPTIPIKAFWVGRVVPDCSTTPPASVTVDTYFDNVYVNPQH